MLIGKKIEMKSDKKEKLFLFITFFLYFCKQNDS